MTSCICDREQCSDFTHTHRHTHTDRHTHTHTQTHTHRHTHTLTHTQTHIHTHTDIHTHTHTYTHTHTHTHTQRHTHCRLISFLAMYYAAYLRYSNISQSLAVREADIRDEGLPDTPLAIMAASHDRFSTADPRIL